MMFSLFNSGYIAANIAGMIAKYFATSLAIEKVVSEPRVISNCFPMATISISFVGLLSRSTMLPASFAAIVPVFMATPTSACASAGASLVPSPVIATSRPAACSFLMYSSLSLCVALAHAPLHDVFQMDDAQQTPTVCHCQRRTTSARNTIAHLLEIGGNLAAL